MQQSTQLEEGPIRISRDRVFTIWDEDRGGFVSYVLDSKPNEALRFIESHDNIAFHNMSRKIVHPKREHTSAEMWKFASGAERRRVNFAPHDY